MRLTKRLINSLIYQGLDLSHQGNERFVVWDADPPGFGVRVYPSGRKAFVLSYRIGGRKRLLTIGTYGVLTLDQARTAARAELAKVETEGADPLADREKERQGETINLERAIRPQINANKRKLTMPYRSDSPHLPGADKVLGSPLNHWR